MRLRRAVVGLAGLLVALGGLALLPVAGAHGGGPVGEPVDLASLVVDIDLVLGGAWVTYADGSVTGVDLGSGPVVRLPERSSPVVLEPGERAVGLVLSGRGYWLFTSTGRVFAVGDAVPLGDLSAATLNDPIVAAAPTASGDGYYMLGADGGVFTFGDAVFYGSVQGIVDEVHGAGSLASEFLTAPVVTLATTPAGYWLVAGDGAVFPFGDAPYHGSIQDAINTGNQLAGIERGWSVTPSVAEGALLARDALEAPIVDVVPAAAEGAGYLMLASDGGIFNFGVSQFYGSAAGELTSPAVASDVTESRGGYVLITQQGDTRTFGAVGADRSTLEGLLADAAERREWAVRWLTKKIESGEYGVGSDNVLRGPAGFQIDLNDCPDDWSDTTGITNNQIRIGHSIPYPDMRERERDLPSIHSLFPGRWQSYRSLALEDYFNWVNKTDPIVVDGRVHKIELLLRADNNSWAKAERNVISLIDEDNVFSVLFGEPKAALDSGAKSNLACVPSPYAMLRTPSWLFSDPNIEPWSTGVGLHERTEAHLWGEWIKRNLADKLPVLVAALTDAPTPFWQGKSQHDYFAEWVEANPGVVSESIYVPLEYDFDSYHSADISGPMTVIAATEPDVFIQMSTHIRGWDAMRWTDENGQRLVDSVDTFFLNSYHKVSGIPVEGVWIFGDAVKAPVNIPLHPKFGEEPFIELMKTNLARADVERPALWWNAIANDHRYGYGYFIGYPYVEALRIAAGLPGGLSRTNFMLSVRSLEIYHPLLFDGLTFNMWGNADPYAIEGSQFAQYDTTAYDEYRLGGSVAWVVRGVLDLDGRIPAGSSGCTWNLALSSPVCEKDGDIEG